MITRTGFIEEITQDEISFRISGDDDYIEEHCIADKNTLFELGLVLSDTVVVGTYLDVTVDADNDIISISVKELPKWTKADIDRSYITANKLLKWLRTGDEYYKPKQYNLDTMEGNLIDQGYMKDPYKK